MVKSRVMALVTGAAVLSLSLVAIQSATAAPGAPTSTEWVNSSAQLGAESAAGYPAGDGWFLGTTAGAPGTNTFDADGVTVTGGQSQFLHKTDQPGDDLQTLASTSNLLSNGAAFFQVPMFLNPGGAGSSSGFTTLRPATPGATDLADGAGQWISSSQFGTIAPNTPTALSAYQAQLDATFPDARIIAYGFNVSAGVEATVKAIQSDGALTYFTPTPVGSVTPASTTVSGFTTAGKGVRVRATGFFPGESISVGLGNGASGGPVEGLTWTADATGAIDETFVDPTSTDGPGNYTITAIGTDSGIAVVFAVAVTADDATPVTPPVVTPVAPVPTPVSGQASFTG